MKRVITISLLVLSFIVLLLHFGSAQINNSFWNGDIYNLSSDGFNDAKDFQVIYTPDSINSTHNFLFVLNASGSDNFLEKYTILKGEFDVDSIQYTGENFNLSTLGAGGALSVAGVEGFHVHGLGTKMYLADNRVTNSPRIRELTFGSAFNLSTLSLTNSYSTGICGSSSINVLRDVFISPNGLFVYGLTARNSGSASEVCFNKVSLTSPFNLGTLPPQESFSIAGTVLSATANAKSLWFQGNKVFMSGAVSSSSNYCGSQVYQSSANRIYEFNILSDGNNYNFSACDSVIARTFSSDVSNADMSLQPSQSPINRFIFLGTKDSSKQLLEYHVIPSQISTQSNEIIGFNTAFTFNLNNYFDNFVAGQVIVTHQADGQTAFLGKASQNFTNQVNMTYLSAPLVTLEYFENNDFTFRTILQEGNFTVDFLACSDVDLAVCSSLTFQIFIIEGAGDVGVQLIGSPADYAQDFNTSLAPYDIDDFFIGANHHFIRVYLNDGTDFIKLLKGQATVFTPFNVNFLSNGTIQTVTPEFTENAIHRIDIFGCSSPAETVCVSSSYKIFVNQGGVLPPSIDQPQGTPSTGFGGLVGLIISLFPEADSISLIEKIVYLLVSMLIVGATIYILGWIMTYYSGINQITFLTLGLIVIFEVVLLAMFASLGYVPLGFIVVAGLILIVVAYFKFKSPAQ